MVSEKDQVEKEEERGKAGGKSRTPIFLAGIFMEDNYSYVVYPQLCILVEKMGALFFACRKPLSGFKVNTNYLMKLFSDC